MARLGAPRLFAALGLIGLALVLRADTWAAPGLARFLLVGWASVGIGVIVGGIIVQWERARTNGP